MPPATLKNKSLLDFSRSLAPNVVAFTSDRSEDFTLRPNQVHLTARQKNFLSAAVKVPVGQFPIVRQIHGKRILTIQRKSCLTSFLGKADGFLTDRKCIPLSVRTADCLSVFVYDPERQAIGLIHAGWRGTKKGILASAVTMMKKKFGSRAKNLKVVLGPCIRSCCYEVGKDFRRFFPGSVLERKNRLYFDLAGVNQKQLQKAGVKKRNIFDSRICTCCNHRFFSYRRQGARAGRMVSLIMLK